MPKILIADDSEMMRKVIRIILENSGYDVIEAQDGIEAVALSKTEMPQIILLDAEMPKMDGWKACKMIKAEQDTAGIPVIMCTGHDLSDEPEQLKSVGANGYVTKPYNPADLLAKIEEILNG